MFLLLLLPVAIAASILSPHNNVALKQRIAQFSSPSVSQYKTPSVPALRFSTVKGPLVDANVQRNSSKNIKISNLRNSIINLTITRENNLFATGRDYQISVHHPISKTQYRTEFASNTGKPLNKISNEKDENAQYPLVPGSLILVLVPIRGIQSMDAQSFVSLCKRISCQSGRVEYSHFLEEYLEFSISVTLDSFKFLPPLHGNLDCEIYWNDYSISLFTNNSFWQAAISGNLHMFNNGLAKSAYLIKTSLKRVVKSIDASQTSTRLTGDEMILVFFPSNKIHSPESVQNILDTVEINDPTLNDPSFKIYESLTTIFGNSFVLIPIS